MKFGQSHRVSTLQTLRSNYCLTIRAFLNDVEAFLHPGVPSISKITASVVHFTFDFFDRCINAISTAAPLHALKGL